MRLALFCYTLLSALYCAQATAAPIHPGLNQSLCLDVAGGSSANGARVQIAHCYGNLAQDWQYIGGTLQVLGKCLDVTNGQTTPGARLQIWDCSPGNQNQQWQLTSGTITWKGHSQCVDIPSGKANDGQWVQVYTANNNKAQQWVTTLSQTAPTPPAPSAPNSGASQSAPGGRLLTFVNKCGQTVWPALQNNGGKAVPNPSGFALAPGQSYGVAVPAGWGGRAWGRTGCQGSGNSLVCESGDTGGLLQPNGIGGQPSSLAEWTMDGWAGGSATQDYFDVSHVDAFNLPMGIKATGGSGICHTVACTKDVLPICPADLQVKNSAGKVVNCLSSCTRYQTDETCCRGAHNTSATCPAPEGAQVFKAACPDAYSYAYDDGTSTWNCAQPSGYVVTFCP